MHLQKAGFDQVCRLEDFDWTAQITVERRLLDAVFSLDFISRHEHVLFVGPVGVGKSFLAQALGYAAVRAGHSVRFTRADAFLRTLAQSRVDHTLEKAFRSFLSPDLLVLDDFGLQKLTAQQSTDLYELIIARHRQPLLSPVTGRWRSGWDCLMTPSWATAPWTVWPMPAIRSSSRAPATVRGSPHTAEGRCVKAL